MTLACGGPFDVTQPGRSCNRSGLLAWLLWCLAKGSRFRGGSRGRIDRVGQLHHMSEAQLRRGLVTPSVPNKSPSWQAFSLLAQWI